MIARAIDILAFVKGFAPVNVNTSSRAAKGLLGDGHCCVCHLCNFSTYGYTRLSISAGLRSFLCKFAASLWSMACNVAHDDWNIGIEDCTLSQLLDHSEPPKTDFQVKNK